MSFDVAAGRAAVLAFDGAFERFDVENQDVFAAALEDAFALQFREHAVEAFTRRRGVVCELLVRERHVDEDALGRLLSVAPRHAQERRAERAFFP